MYIFRTLPKESEMETEDGDVDEHTDYTRCMYKGGRQFIHVSYIT